MSQKKRYALIGTGSRAGMFVDAITNTYRDSAELVAFADLSQTRMNWYNEQLQQRGYAALPTYLAADFDRMLAETKPDTVIVTTMDATHHQYIIRAMELGCDGVLMNTAIAEARDPIRMARAMKLAVRPGATPTSPDVWPSAVMPIRPARSPD